MSRMEFPGKIKDQAHTRSKGFCENRACGLKLQVGKLHYDHILPDALGGKPVLANCQVLCMECHAVKTKDDVRRIRKADRQRKAHIGAHRPKQQIKSAGFPKKERPEKLPIPARRGMFV